MQLLREEKRSKRDKEKGRVFTVVLHVSVLTRNSLNVLKIGLVAKLATHGFILFVQVLILLLFQIGFIVMIAPNDKFLCLSGVYMNYDIFLAFNDNTLVWVRLMYVPTVQHLCGANNFVTVQCLYGENISRYNNRGIFL